MKTNKAIIILVVPTIERTTTKTSEDKIMSGIPTDAYNQGWETIFGQKQRPAEA